MWGRNPLSPAHQPLHWLWRSASVRRFSLTGQFTSPWPGRYGPTDTACRVCHWCPGTLVRLSSEPVPPTDSCLAPGAPTPGAQWPLPQEPSGPPTQWPQGPPPQVPSPQEPRGPRHRSPHHRDPPPRQKKQLSEGGPRTSPPCSVCSTELLGEGPGKCVPRECPYNNIYIFNEEVSMSEDISWPFIHGYKVVLVLVYFPHCPPH